MNTAPGVSSVALCFVECYIRGFIQAFLGVSIARIHGHSDAATGMQRRSLERYAGAEAVDNPLANHGDPSWIDGADQQDGKFIAPKTRHTVRFTYCPAKQRRAFEKDCVAHIMSEGVVDFLEVVEIDEHEREGRTVTAANGYARAELLREHAPVGQRSQCIVIRDLFELAMTFAQLGGALDDLLFEKFLLS